MLGLFRSKSRKPDFSRHQALSAKPIRTVYAELILNEQGGGKIKVPLRQSRWAGWLFRLPEGATKTFELDPIGVLVWNSCDGKTSVQQIIRRLAREYQLGLREAEVPTVRFLNMLLKKGLLAMSMRSNGQAGKTT